MKVLKTIKRIFIGIILVIFFAFTITMTILLLNYNDFGITQFDDTSLLIIKNGFSSDTYKKGSLVIVENKPVKDYKIGEEIFTYHMDQQNNNSIDVQLGVIAQIHEEDSSVTFANGETYSRQFIMGTGEKIYPKLGTYLGVIESKWGFLFIILVPNFFLFVYQLYSLIVEIKYGKEEDYTEA